MRYLNYGRLTDITKTVSPYRGSTNRFPIGSRTQNTKYFLVEELNGEQVYRIVYGTSWDTKQLTKEEYDKAVLAKDPDVHEREMYSVGGSVEKSYWRYTRKPNTLGFVRSDNTFEFTKDAYYQGEKQIMSGWSCGWVYSSSRHGGMVYRNGGVFHPIWKGMRINCETFEPTTPYTVVGRRVSRKNANTLLAGYKDFYKVADVMLASMDTGTISSLGADLILELGLNSKEHFATWTPSSNTYSLMIDEARKRIPTAPMDSAVLFCMAHNLDNYWRRAQNVVDSNVYVGYSGRTETDTSTLFTRMRSKVNKDLYRVNDSVMKKVEFEQGAIYPPSEWGVEIVVNGEVVEQYS